MFIFILGILTGATLIVVPTMLIWWAVCHPGCMTKEYWDKNSPEYYKRRYDK